MQLFNINADKSLNHLPHDGEVRYLGVLFSPDECSFYTEKLFNNLSWQQDQAIIFGKKYITKRKVAWYGDEPYSYTYSNVSKNALPWSEELNALKAIVERESSDHYNSCLANLYHTGEEGMAWHSDDEVTLKKHGTIASLTFGAERKFSFKHKRSGEKVDILLENGSLLLMKGVTQSHWLHRLPPTKRVLTPRINLTFRTIHS